MTVRPILLAMGLFAGVAAPGAPPRLELLPAVTIEDEIKAALAAQYAAWDARNIDDFLGAFWRSPNLVYVVEGAVWVGWDEVHGRINRQYPDRGAMGHPVLERLEVHPVSADVVTTIEWWTVVFATTRVRGNTANAWHRFPEGWRVVETCTSVNEDP